MSSPDEPYVPSAANFDGSVSGIPFDPSDLTYGASPPSSPTPRPNYGRSQSVPVVRSAPMVVASATPIASNDASADAYPVAEATIAPTAAASRDGPVLAAATTDTATAARNGEFVMPSIFCPDADYAGRCGANAATTRPSFTTNTSGLSSIFQAPPGWVDPLPPRRNTTCTSTFHPATGPIPQPQSVAHTGRRHSTASSSRPRKRSIFRRMFRPSNNY